ncbi:hypothetical protein [Streptomyces dangxiongensis]|uniref:hypothetical protein n=1 Tax=Streptomyces dangxiongensis TaxID=1442032 RepID=UPI001F08CF0D|nr:hypothetical protein [Streptomyces dangxiongensis]
MTVPPDVRRHCRQARTSARTDGLVPALTLLLRALSPKTPPRGPRGHAILPRELLEEFAAEDAAAAAAAHAEESRHAGDAGHAGAAGAAEGAGPTDHPEHVEGDTPAGAPGTPPAETVTGAGAGAGGATPAEGVPGAHGGVRAEAVTGVHDGARVAGVVPAEAVGLLPGLALSRSGDGEGAAPEWGWAVAWLRLGMSERLRDACLAHLASRHADGAPLLMQQMVKGTLAEVLLEHLEIEGVLDDVCTGLAGPLGPLRPTDDRRLAALQEQITRADRTLLRLLGAHGFTADGPGAGAHASELLADAYGPAAPLTGGEDA